MYYNTSQSSLHEKTISQHSQLNIYKCGPQFPCHLTRSLREWRSPNPFLERAWLHFHHRLHPNCPEQAFLKASRWAPSRRRWEENLYETFKFFLPFLRRENAAHLRSQPRVSLTNLPKLYTVQLFMGHEGAEEPLFDKSPFFIQFYNYALFYGMHMVEILNVTFKHAYCLLLLLIK